MDLRLPTPRQLQAVKFCESMLDIKFTGDLNNRNEVSDFLSENLEDAKDKLDFLRELACEYDAYINDLD